MNYKKANGDSMIEVANFMLIGGKKIATIKGDISLIKNGTVLKKQDGSSVNILSVAMDNLENDVADVVIDREIAVGDMLS